MRRVVIVMAMIVFVSACGSSAKTSEPKPQASTTTAAESTEPGTGVTDDTIKLGIMMVDLKCVEGAVDELRPDERRAYEVFIDQINKKGINGRKIEPVFKAYCPVQPADALTACTGLTEDEKVFATVGIFYDPSGDVQLCFAKQHNTPIIADSLNEALMKKAPPGFMVTPNISSERRLKVIMELLAGEKLLAGKTVSILSNDQEKARAQKVVGDELDAIGVERGTDASLSIGDQDTTVPQQQLDSFIERWKGDGTNALVMVGADVSSRQFVEKIKAAIPEMLLIADNTQINDAGQAVTKAGISPNPYDGAITAEGQTGLEHTKTEHFEFCSGVWERATGVEVPLPTEEVRMANGKKNDIYGTVGDACLFTNYFATIARKVGKHLNSTNWVRTIDTFGPIDQMSTVYASLGAGKYDSDDTYGLVEFDPTVGNAGGDWNHLTPVKNVTGG
ncbi:MAG TPA: ABC transporter substrate-binding protein [Acidimicrobiia bacterium]|nr:ABC transporter substrate-binding protein [Acidimicrobiia bacterium]